MSPRLIRLLLYVILLLLIACSFVVARPHLQAEALWTGLFVEAVAVAVTVGIIDNLLRQESARRNRPARFAAFREASLVYSRARALWFAIINSAFDAARHGALVTEAETLLDPSFGTIVAELNLDADAPVVPRRTWRIHIQQQVTELEERIGRCLQRYAAYMEPQMIVALQNLEHSPFIVFAKIVPNLPKVGAELGVNYGPRFTYGANGTAKEFVESLKALSDLLKREAPKFKDLLPKGSPMHFDLDDELKALRGKIGK